MLFLDSLVRECQKILDSGSLAEELSTTKKKRERDLKQRRTWGSLSPVTRNTQNPKAYNRQKARKWNQDDFPTAPFLF